jgi:hypothetical protein
MKPKEPEGRDLVIIGKFAPFADKHCKIITETVGIIRQKSLFDTNQECISVTALLTHSEQSLFADGIRIDFGTRIRILTERMISLGLELNFRPIILHTHMLENTRVANSNFDHITRQIRTRSIIISSDNLSLRCLYRKPKIQLS